MIKNGKQTTASTPLNKYDFPNQHEFARIRAGLKRVSLRKYIDQVDERMDEGDLVCRHFVGTGREANNLHVGSQSRLDPGLAVLDNNAAGNIDSHILGRKHKQVWLRFPGVDVVRAKSPMRGGVLIEPRCGQVDIDFVSRCV